MVSTKSEVRLDKLLVDRGLVKSRERAASLIEKGSVLVAGEVVNKASKKVSTGVEIQLKEGDIPWVSRGGLKLEKALDHWAINPEGFVCLDIGASTGGFTQVLLHRGARQVYALDVGHNQLAEEIRKDPRVTNLEGVNIREAKAELLSEPADFCCIDVSFISLELVLPEVLKFLKPNGLIVALIKPQFEVGKGNLDKKGIVKDPNRKQEVVAKIKEAAVRLNLRVHEVILSPIAGGGGNEEFLIYLQKK